jgi:ankyrin repeat protein
MLQALQQHCRSFTGIWRFIDFSDFGNLERDTSLHETVNQKQQGFTPLHLACIRQNYQIIQFLLHNGADINAMCYNRTPLYLVTLYGFTDLVEEFLKHGALPNIMCKDISPLHLAASKGIVELCSVLLKYGADVSILGEKYGTPLHVAVKLDHKYIAKFLLENGANIELQNGEGETPLHIASQKGNIELVKTLISFAKKTLYSIKDNEGRTALHLAANHQKDEIVKLLTTACPSIIPIVDNRGKTALFYMHPRKRNPLRITLSQHNNQIVGFQSLFNQKQFSDIALFPEVKSSQDKNDQFYCHKVILWARWPSLRTRLEEFSETDKAENCLDIPEVDADTLKCFIYFLYTDQIYVHRMKLEKVDEGNLIQKLRDFAFKQKFNYLVGLCNVLLEPISKETGVNFIDPKMISISGSTTFQTDFNQMMDNTKFSDVEFIVKGDESSAKISGHKCILFAKCDYFKAMFDPARKLRESHSRYVHMEMHRNVLLGILSYLYASVIPKNSLNERFATSLLDESTRLMIAPLGVVCQLYLIDRVDRSNVCSLFSLADSLHADFLREECLDFITRNYLEMKKADELNTLEPALLQEVKQFFACC